MMKRLTEILRPAGEEVDLDEEDLDNDDDDDGVLFTTKMREVTKKVHKLSDNLVNAKLSIAMGDDKIWREGLLIFYEIFNFLETVLLKRKREIQAFGRMNETLDGLERTEAFEEDLNYYYGSGYLRSSSYQIRPAVANYLKHLRMLEEREPLRLLAYVYHLYMGLLSGGQLLKKKRDIKRSVITLGGIIKKRTSNSSSSSGSGDAVTTFNTQDDRTISDIKKQLRFTMNDIASDLSRDEKNSILAESVMVFKQNNLIIRSIENTGLIACMNVVKNTFYFVMIVAILIFIIRTFSSLFLQELEQELNDEQSI
jgi:heme oxygenase